MGGWTGSCPCSFSAMGCKVVHRCWASIVGAAVSILVLLGLGTPARLLRAFSRFMLSAPDQFEKAFWARCAHLHLCEIDLPAVHRKREWRVLLHVVVQPVQRFGHAVPKGMSVTLC